MIITS